MRQSTGLETLDMSDPSEPTCRLIRLHAPAPAHHSTRRQSESYPKLNPGAIIVADNMLRGAAEGVKRYGRAVRAKPGITSVLLPVGSGIEVSRFEPT
jgi:hypothetical protein